MNKNNYKITKFAIKQNNLELLNNVLKGNNLSEVQLSECLVLAKDKTDIYQVLSKLIVDTSEESEESKESEVPESEIKICIDPINKIFAKDNSKLMLAFHSFLNGYEMPKEELWTTEQVDKVNSEGWSIINYMVECSIYEPNLFEKALKLSNKLEKTLTYYCKRVIDKSCFPKFKIFWEVAKEKNLTGLIEEERILKYIRDKKIRESVKFIEYLLVNQDYDVQHEDQITMDTIVRNSFGLYSVYPRKIADKLLKHPNYKPNYLNFLKANWWTNCNSINRKILLESNKFFLDKDELQNLIVSGNTNFASDFLKYCPQNVQLVEASKKETFNSREELVKEYFECKQIHTHNYFVSITLKKDLGKFKKGDKFSSLEISSHQIKLDGYYDDEDKTNTYTFDICSQISFK